MTERVRSLDMKVMKVMLYAALEVDEVYSVDYKPEWKDGKLIADFGTDDGSEYRITLEKLDD